MVEYGATEEAVLLFMHSLDCSCSLPTLIARLRRAIEAEDFWVLHEIDPQALLSRGGFSISPARQILFFHPRFMARLLTAHPAALLEAPLKFGILELPDTHVTLRWIDPATAFARYGNAALSDLGRELAEACEKIATAALAPQAAIGAQSFPMAGHNGSP